MPNEDDEPDRRGPLRRARLSRGPRPGNPTPNETEAELAESEGSEIQVHGCNSSHGYTFHAIVVTHEDHGIVDSRDDAIEASKRRLLDILPRYVARVNDEMDQWLERQSCGRGCVTKKSRDPAALPPQWRVVDVTDDTVEVVGDVVAHARIECDEAAES